MTQQTITLGYAVWAGGSGNLAGSDWITGYLENIGTNGVPSFVSWIYGPAPADSSIYFDSTLYALGVLDTAVGAGGVLTGSVTTTGDISIDSGSSYLLNGNLSVEDAEIASGTLTVNGVGSTLTATAGLADSTNSALVISGGASASVTDQMDVNGATTITGLGSALTIDGILLVGNNSPLVISDGASVSVTSVSANEQVQVGVGPSGDGTLTITGGSTLSIGANLLIANGQGQFPGETVVYNGALTIDGAGSTLTVGGNLDVGGIWGTGTVAINNGAVVSVAGDALIGEGYGSNNSTLSINGIGSTLAVGGFLELGADFVAGVVSDNGALDVTGDARVTIEEPVYINGSSTISVDATSAIEIGGSTNLTAGTIVVDVGQSIQGNGTVVGDINNNGIIEAIAVSTAVAGPLTLAGAVTGTGTMTIDGSSELILNGSIASSQTVEFTGSTGTLTLGDSSAFLGAIEGLVPGDSIVLSGVGQSSGDALISATIGTLNGVQTLQIWEGATTNPNVKPLRTIYVPLQAGGSTPLANDFFEVGQSGTDTVLTLTQGNPVALAVNAPTSGASAAGIKVGIISNSFNALGGESSDILSGALPAATYVLSDQTNSLVDSLLGVSVTDEGRAMAQVVHDIAPQATIYFAAGITDYAGANLSNSLGLPIDPAVNQMTSAITSLVNEGCNIIVDDLQVLGDVLGGPISQAIQAAFNMGVTYITAAGNSKAGTTTRPTISAHALDVDALAVAAVNILATPNPPSATGDYISTQTEPASDLAITSSIPDQFISGVDGDPTTLPLGTGLDPFFGTSAAAPSVAAVAALMMQANPALKSDPLMIDSILRESAVTFTDNSPGLTFPTQGEGAGLVNASAAVALATITDILPVAVPGALFASQGGPVIAVAQAAQTAVIDPLFDEGPIGTLTIYGPGTNEIDGVASVGTLEIASGGDLLLQGGSLITDPVTVYANGNVSGYGTIAGGEIVNGTITASGGTLDITGSISGSGTLTFDAGASFTLEGTVAATESLIFNAPSETLTLGTGADVSAPISGFQSFDVISLDGQQITSAAYDTGTDVLAIIGSGGSTYDLNFIGSYQQSDFPVVNGEIVMPCFLRGTRIATPCGEVLIEHLAVGDLVDAQNAGPAPIKWVGHRRVDCRNHPKPQKIWPVRVHAGAFGDALPHRDLWLSPDHAVFVDDVLIPIKRLVNGVSIEQVPMDEVTYYHIELDDHDVLLAEGLSAESYLDTGDRFNFENGGGPIALHPDFSARRWATAHIWEALGCARLILIGPELDAARRRVNARITATDLAVAAVGAIIRGL